MWTLSLPHGDLQLENKTREDDSDGVISESDNGMVRCVRVCERVS